MPHQVSELEIPGVLYLQPQVFSDERGSFLELWNAARDAGLGIDARFVQDNVVRSRHGVLRGLHFQLPFAQGKFVTAVHGAIFDVAVDLRPGSATFGKWVGQQLVAESGAAIYIPPGFAHGYQVTSAEAVVVYKCTEFYHAECDHAVVWNDPQLAIEWPIKTPVLSAKDRAAPSFEAVCRELGLQASA